MSIGGPLFVPATQDLTKNLGNLPDMNDALRSTFQLLTFEILVKTIDEGGILIETTTPVSFYGSCMPYRPTPTEIKEHGQRAWDMLEVNTDVAVKMDNDFVVIYQGVQYRILNYSDFTKFGYQHFQMIQDYIGSGPNG